MMKHVSASLFLFAILIPVLATAQPDLVTLDGVISLEEKQSLKSVIQNGNSSVYLDPSEPLVKISVSSEPLHVASLCIGTEDEVYILHASAALGMMRYALRNGQWNAGPEFKWGMRDTTMSAEALSARSRYLDQNLWVATTMGMGKDGEVEFLINPDLFGRGLIYLAAGLMPESNPQKIISHSLNVAGGCADHALVSGSPESVYFFELSGWHKIRLR